MSIRTQILACASVMAFACVAASGQNFQVVKPINPNVIQLAGAVNCPAGFVAKPAKIDPAKKYDQSYTCTGPVAFCMPGFGLQSPIVGYGPVPPGGLMGQPYYGSPVVLNGAKQMTFTCTQPSAPPK